MAVFVWWAVREQRECEYTIRYVAEPALHLPCLNTRVNTCCPRPCPPRQLGC